MNKSRKLSRSRLSELEGVTPSLSTNILCTLFGGDYTYAYEQEYDYEYYQNQGSKIKDTDLSLSNKTETVILMNGKNYVVRFKGYSGFLAVVEMKSSQWSITLEYSSKNNFETQVYSLKPIGDPNEGQQIRFTYQEGNAGNVTVYEK